MNKPDIKIIFITLCHVELVKLGRAIINSRASTCEQNIGIDKNIVLSSKLQ